MKKTIIQRKRKPKPTGTAKGGRKKLDIDIVKSKSISFKLTEETYNTLYSISRLENISLSALITSAIDMKITKYKNKNQNKMEFENIV
jgi:hypothetical protein